MDPNDTDAIFAAEAEIDSRIVRTRHGQRDRKSNAGEEAVVAARGGIDSTFGDEPGEDEPLLGRSRDDKGRGDSSGGAEWLGIAEFDGLPWHKRPSVSRSVG